MNVEIVVPNCQKCHRFLKGHKSLGSLLGDVFSILVFVFVFWWSGPQVSRTGQSGHVVGNGS